MSHLDWADALTIVGLIVGAFVFGYWLHERKAEGRFPFDRRPTNNSARIWRYL